MIRRHSRIESIDQRARQTFANLDCEIGRIADEFRTPIVTWDHATGKIVCLPPSDPLQRNPYLVRLQDEHEIWLKKFAPAYLRNWKKHTFDAALAEATVASMLRESGSDVFPNEDTRKKKPKPRPDFRCIKDDSEFYVEVTGLLRGTVTKSTSLAFGEAGPSCFKSLNPTIWEKWQRDSAKQKQITAMPAATALAMVTFHDAGCTICFDRPFLERAFRELPSTELHAQELVRNASAIMFVCPYPNGMLHALGSIRCILNPRAKYLFDPKWLPGADFGELELTPSDSGYQIRWFQSETP